MAKNYKTIFVIDDDEVANFVTEKLLKYFDPGYSISTYSNPVEAFHLLQQLNEQKTAIPDLILLDINMPHMDGFQFLQKMKEYGLSEKVEVIMYSSSSSFEDKKRSKTFSNVIGYLEKPFSAQAYGRMLDKTPY